jgi:EPS-associated MarR family transcriptional regulator
MNNNDHLNILRMIEKKSNNNQRNLANELGFSLGKINYCLGKLSKKGLIKIRNFKNNRNKLVYKYLLTSKGVKNKTILMIDFLKIKTKEYEELQKELEKTNNSKF